MTRKVVMVEKSGPEHKKTPCPLVGGGATLTDGVTCCARDSARGLALTQAPFFPSTMSSELFNANPTVFSSTKSSPSRITEHSAQSLWLWDQNDGSDTENEDGEVEEIDQDEIFGTLISFPIRVRSKI